MCWMTGILFLAGVGIFSLCHCVQTDPRAYPASYQIGTRTSFSRVEQLGHEADHLPPPSAKVKNMKLCHHPPTCFHSVVFN